MPIDQTQQQKEASRFTFVLEGLLRKLIHFLVGKISLVKLQELVSAIFVEEAEKSIKSEESSKGASLTKLALLTGLDTRTLAKIKGSGPSRQLFEMESTFLYDLVPGLALLDHWATQAPFIDENRAPKVLKINGSDDSFESLFALTVKARGITPTSLLDRFTVSGTVEVNPENNTVRLVRQSYLPFNSDDHLSTVEVGFAAIVDMMDTVFHNINALQKNEEALYQQSAWTRRLAIPNQKKLRSAIRELLNETDGKAREVLAQYEEPAPGPGQMTAGFSLFYFEHDD